MDTHDNFYLTLPSNVIANGRTNKISHFFTELPRVINLKSRHWEVALVEIDYPRTWNNIREDTSRITFYEKKQNVLRSDINHLPIGNYNSSKGLITALNSLRLESFNSTFEYNRITNKVCLNIFRDEGIRLTSKLAMMLGFHNKTKFLHDTLQDNHRSETESPTSNEVSVPTPDREVSIVSLNEREAMPAYTFIEASSYSSGNRNKRTPDIKEFNGDGALDLNSGLYSIFIYTNIIEPVLIGDSYAPLLRTVFIEGNYGDLIQKIFTHPHYITINTENLKMIEISLRNDQGEFIPFEYGKVMIKLHFRKKVKKY